MTLAAGAASITMAAAACGGSSHSSAPPAAAAPAPGKTVNLTVWTAFSGVNATSFNYLVSQFNSSQSQYHVTALSKGSYSQVLSDTIAAFKAHAAPDITQIFDAGTATIMDSNGSYVPVYKLMSQYKIPFATTDFIGGAASYYETASNQLDSLPFNSSTPVLFYNKTELQKAGISQPPTTWNQFASDAAQLLAHGQKCALTSSGAYVMWTDMEEFSTWNGYQYATNDNGYSAVKGTKLKIDSAPLVNHLTLLGQLAQKGQYMWNGVSTSTVPLFTNGTCAMYEQSSADLGTIQAAAKFPFGVSELPIADNDANAPQNTVVGGASMWVMSGAPAVHYRGDAEFLHYLMSPQAQAYWASHTGYVPVTPASSDLLKSQGFYSSHPNDLVAVKELTNKTPTSYTRGIRLGYLPEVRQAEASAIAAVLSGKQSASAALASAQSQGDSILTQFASQYGG
ncbi:MAG TPA: extracellular solute-binding protein [Acidimicrobiales bacterium]|nr:extracellular solute-binding protein [Acidimicrobiales bacterium]